MEINCIRLLVTDFDKCFNFYSETLKLKVSWGKLGGDYASFDAGSAFGFSLFKSDIMAEVIGNDNKSMPQNHREKSLLVFSVNNVDQTYMELKNRGVKFINKPVDKTGWGMRVAHFYDPENNLLEIWSPLPKEKWDKDLIEDSKEFEKQ